MMPEEINMELEDKTMIRVRHRGSFKNIEKFLNKMAHNNFLKYLNDCGAKGVEALASVTPKESGETASSWSYSIENTGDSLVVYWSNSKTTVNGTPIVILLKYGHATGTGGYVRGYDFIDPSIRPIFDSFVNQMWNEVTTS
ncbi:MAG: hypothetical protein IJJ10_03295 [Bacillus sp. (in: Bacteria)]|nr:hypothetical protein [Bacillus sp. (in: firmicutes)]